MSKLNPNEAPKGYVAKTSLIGCYGCAFKGASCDGPDKECRWQFRKDGVEVIFVRKARPGMPTKERLKELRAAAKADPRCADEPWYVWFAEKVVDDYVASRMKKAGIK